jgi:hypothetical protein
MERWRLAGPWSGLHFAAKKTANGTTATLAIPAKKITHSDAMPITLGAKRRWPAFMLA